MYYSVQLGGLGNMRVDESMDMKKVVGLSMIGGKILATLESGDTVQIAKGSLIAKYSVYKELETGRQLRFGTGGLYFCDKHVVRF